MGALHVHCLILSLCIYGTFGHLSLLENKTSDNNGLLSSTASGKVSNVLRDILNQESLVRFSMVQKIQNLVMDAIDNKNDRQIIMTKLSEVTKDLRALETRNQIVDEENVKSKEELKVIHNTVNDNKNETKEEIQDLKTRNQKMEEENAKLKEELRVVHGTMNTNRNFTKEEIQSLDQKIKRNTLAFQNENHRIAMKNADFEKQLDLFKKKIENDLRREIQTLKMKEQSTMEKINVLNESQIYFAKTHLEKIKQLDDDIGNKSMVFKSNDRALAKEVEDLKNQMDGMNSTSQKSSVIRISERVKNNEEKIENFSVAVKEALDSFKKDLNESNEILSKVLSNDYGSCWEILLTFPSLRGRDGVYKITINSEVKSVYCDMTTDGGGWTAIQRRRDGSTDFYRTWREYKQGFGDPSTNYWIGNDAIHELTKKKDQELRVELQRFNADKAYAQYSTFYVGNEGTKYKLTVTGYSGTAGDSLTYPHNGMKFTTKDQDNDRYSGGNCAVSRHGAWWYRSCANSNLNGMYGQSGDSGYQYPVWYHWKRKTEALKQTVMMIRHKN
ncbi:fibroleukin-like [Saccostrea cucullata]|uniref:fibroleukin-like n=1 Tax=Saccostrea cuccullata TaxID=36930 RepID=UPI002ED3D18C